MIVTETNGLYMMVKSVINIGKLRSALFQCFVQCNGDNGQFRRLLELGCCDCRLWLHPHLEASLSGLLLSAG